MSLPIRRPVSLSVQALASEKFARPWSVVPKAPVVADTWDPQPDAPGGCTEIAAWFALAVVAAIVVSVLAIPILWFRWHPVRHDPWSLKSVSADGRALVIDADGCAAGTPHVRVEESERYVLITVTEALHRYVVGGGDCGQVGHELTVSLRQPLGTRSVG